MTLKIVVAGATGRMGQMLIEAVHAAPDCTLHGALEHAGSAALGAAAVPFFHAKGGAEPICVSADLAATLRGADCLIDFTRPEGTLAHLAVCAELGVKVVIGTTGFSEPQKAEIAAFAQRTGVVFAPNMSVGVNVTLKLLQLAAQSFNDDYDIEIVEMHHRHKVDAPSGTALKMGEVIAAAQGKNLADVAVYERYGHTGERQRGSIGFATLRGGDVVGDHTVTFATQGERIELSHKSSSRQSYAQGSLRAARFLSGQTTGLFDMFDVLGLNA